MKNFILFLISVSFFNILICQPTSPKKRKHRLPTSAASKKSLDQKVTRCLFPEGIKITNHQTIDLNIARELFENYKPGNESIGLSALKLGGLDHYKDLCEKHTFASSKALNKIHKFIKKNPNFECCITHTMLSLK